MKTSQTFFLAEVKSCLRPLKLFIALCSETFCAAVVNFVSSILMGLSQKSLFRICKADWNSRLRLSGKYDKALDCLKKRIRYMRVLFRSNSQNRKINEKFMTGETNSSNSFTVAELSRALQLREKINETQKVPGSPQAWAIFKRQS